MDTKSLIFQKLEHFIKKYYTNELIKGTLFFIALGLLYFIFTFLIEYFFWFSTSVRSILFWSFVLFEFLLLIKFIAFPLIHLFKLKKGINYESASVIIGNHFSEVQDKLLNFLQLTQSSSSNEFVLASIDQKANNLSPIPFSNAINFKENKKYLPYALIPIIVLLLFLISGNSDIVSGSFNRIIAYDSNFKKPAPFQFSIDSKNLIVEQNKNFVLKVRTTGKFVPENVSIVYNNETYLLESKENGLFQYTFQNVNSSLNFHLIANDIVSDDYNLKVINVPTLVDFEMKIIFPSYLNKKSETVIGTGNITVPEGSLITWNIKALSTNKITLTDNKTYNLNYLNDSFSISKKINSNYDYSISLSNEQKLNYETLNYKISVLKDQYPVISVSETPDTLKLKSKYYIGNISDDYGLYALYVKYFDISNPKNIYKKSLGINSKLVDQFVYAFPQGLNIEAGKNYQYYFEVLDNDASNGYKSTRSEIFNYYELTAEQKEDISLKEQKNSISQLEKALSSQTKNFNDLNKLEQLNKQKNQLDYKDQKKIEDFLQRQKDQQDMMQEYSNKLKENLQQFKPIINIEEKQDLLNRLEKNEKDALKNEKLLKELDELTKKLEKEELFDKMDKLKQQSKSQQKSLEQLVELTKRFYVEQKAEKLMDDLNKLADKQDKLSDSPNNDSKKQEDLNNDFKDLQKELEDLQKENKDLKDPLEIPETKQDENSIQKDQENAKNDLENNKKDSAKKSQKSASKKMKEMSQKMAASMEGGDMQQNQEDAKAMRQILDNLLTYSFDQEKLLLQLKQNTSSKSSINTYLKQQQDLKNQFKHVDDSLFTLALRQPKISEVILKEVEEVHYNIDQALEYLPSMNRYKGVSHQQFALSSANKLADMLSNVQNEMNMSMNSSGGSGKSKPGKGQGQGKQLSDIIQSQKGLGEKMKDGMSSPKPNGNKPNGKEGQGASSGEGTDGNEGQASKILEILKQQQELRESLENELQKAGMSGNGKNAMQQMKDLEKQLINKGFTQENYNRMLQIQHELLKLETAQKQQGQDTKRESNTSKDLNGSNTSVLPPALLKYMQSIEILNRQSLPLQPNFNQKVQHYFNN